MKLISINISEKKVTYIMSDNDYNNLNDLSTTQTFDLDCQMDVQSIVNFLDQNYKWSNSFWPIVEEPFKKELQDATFAEGLSLFDSEKYNLPTSTSSRGFGFLANFKLSENDSLFIKNIDSLPISNVVKVLVIDKEETYLEMSFSERSGFETETNNYSIYFIDGNRVSSISDRMLISELKSLVRKGHVIYNTEDIFCITQIPIKKKKYEKI